MGARSRRIAGQRADHFESHGLVPAAATDQM